MSMNLNATCKGEKIYLWQIPTQITYTICVDENGPVGELKGKDARRALQAYCQWVEYSTNEVWTSLEALEEAKENVREHLEYIKPFLNSKKLLVWVM